MGILFGRIFENVVIQDYRVQVDTHGRESQISFLNVPYGDNFYTISVENPSNYSVIVYGFLFTEPKGLGWVDFKLNGTVMQPYETVLTELKIVCYDYNPDGIWTFSMVSVVT